MRSLPLVIAALVSLTGSPASADAPDYEVAPGPGRVLESPLSGTSITILADRAQVGGAEVELARVTFPPHSQSAAHEHYSVEIIYVLSGRLEHIVNGRATLLVPGSVGIVRPGDEVVHRVPGEEPATALVVWAPGGEADRLSKSLELREPAGE